MATYTAMFAKSDGELDFSEFEASDPQGAYNLAVAAGEGFVMDIQDAEGESQVVPNMWQGQERKTLVCHGCAKPDNLTTKPDGYWWHESCWEAANSRA
jgi:hypothetical protein